MTGVLLWWTWLNDFMGRGGPLLWVLAAVVVMIWLLMFERLIYLGVSHPKLERQVMARWQAQQVKTGWMAQALRQGLLGRAERQLMARLDFIKGLVAICPMLGLLGTVTGMIEVFDVLAFEGTGDARLMSAGIAKATLPTMAGMVAALAGLFTHARLHKGCQRRLQRLADEMTRED